jgi:integrase
LRRRITHALTKAVEWKLLRKAAREELTAIRTYLEPDGRLRYLSGKGEAERLLQACEDWFRPIVVTALHTGMRKGELLGLTWDVVDITHGILRLRQTKNGKVAAVFVVLLLAERNPMSLLGPSHSGAADWRHAS